MIIQANGRKEIMNYEISTQENEKEENNNKNYKVDSDAIFMTYKYCKFES